MYISLGGGGGRGQKRWRRERGGGGLFVNQSTSNGTGAIQGRELGHAIHMLWQWFERDGAGERDRDLGGIG